MDDTANEAQENVQKPEVEDTPTMQTPDVGFPISSPKPKSGGNRWIFIILGLLILAGGGIFLVARSTKNKESGEISPTPRVSGLETGTPTPTAAAVDKEKVRIEIQNGTGYAGEAAYLQGVLKNLGYLSITVGNATSQDNSTTTVTFAKSLNTQVVNEITSKLEEIYKSVETKTSATLNSDVLVLTGLRKGVTPKPTETQTPTPTASGSSTTTP